MDNRKYYVYLYLRGKDSVSGAKGTPYYVGKGKGQRARHKARHQVKVPDNPRDIVFAATDLFEFDALQLEMFLIHIYGRTINKTGCLRNLSDGGEGGASGIKRTEAHIAIIAALGRARKGAKFSEKSKELLRQRWAERKAKGIPSPNLGRKHKPEHIRKRADAIKGHPKWYFGPNPNKGKVWPAEMRARISTSLTGKKQSEQTVNKRKESNKLYWQRVRNGECPPPSYFKSHKGSTISLFYQSDSPELVRPSEQLIGAP